MLHCCRTKPGNQQSQRETGEFSTEYWVGHLGVAEASHTLVNCGTESGAQRRHLELFLLPELHFRDLIIKCDFILIYLIHWLYLGLNNDETLRSYGGYYL